MHVSGCGKFLRTRGSPENPLFLDAEKIEFLLTGIDHQHIIIHKNTVVNPSNTRKMMDLLQGFPVPYSYTRSNCGKISGVVGNCSTIPPLIQYLHFQSPCFLFLQMPRQHLGDFVQHTGHRETLDLARITLGGNKEASSQNIRFVDQK